MSWPLAKFKDVAQIVTGSTPKKVDGNYNGTVPFVTPGDLGSNALISNAKVTVTEKGAKSGRLLPKGTVMVCCIGATIGKVGIAERDVISNQQINSLIFDELQVYPKYGYYFCLTIKPLLLNRSSSTTMPIVNKSNFSEFEIPLPPLDEQKRIAAILDKADAIRRKRQQAIKLTDDFLRSVFLDMFGDPVTNPKGFPIGTIRDFVETANYGSSGKASETKGQYPMLRMGNITYEGAWDFTNLKYIDLSEKDKPKYLTQKGDLLFNRTNSKELVGKTAVFEEEKPMAIAGYLIRVRTNELGNNYYLSGYLNSAHGKKTLVGMCKSIVGMANINAQELQDIKILLPPIELQNEYEQIVRATKSKLKSFDKSAELLDDNFNSLSQQALKGQL
ncbi:restriction endonuclease subunit S [Pseudoalteromonas sp. SG41-1]|uniref:restriction endonuclease subunit S n=1 Tax=Pseudoalteromonas sp. SG41-1 TaxID=2760979 RepID=UPI0016014EB7|nr:restriction endonuclease subunit S [Pseudoalteromonas sp. SG41-1]MBB1504099.1 restriction endonuclease subunit S [Pseudoalteromonas sp. SG41-1]